MPDPIQIPVLDAGFVTLLDSMGTDLTVVNAARVSFAKRSQGTLDAQGRGRLCEADEKLIRYLAHNEHWTPFGHCQATLHLKMPIFVARQWMRSNIGIVYNEVSRRYIDSPPEFYTPSHWRGRPTGGMKQGSSQAPFPDAWAGLASDALKAAHENANAEYQKLLRCGVAPEMARMVLPQSTYTEFWMTASLAAFARVVSLREDSHAQWETQQYALAVATHCKSLWPVSWASLNTKDPHAPHHYLLP